MTAQYGGTPTLEAEVGTRAGKAFCVPKREMSAATVMTFRGAVDLCIGEPDLVVDLSGVRVIDEAGIRALLDVLGGARDRGAHAAVVVAAGAVREALEQAGLDRTVRVSETL